ncbi:MAG TPA: hypothetical protein VGY31_16820 [Terriglobia bacterium]|nr:hypothetical protein [Terriglobia bacterium]
MRSNIRLLGVLLVLFLAASSAWPQDQDSGQSAPTASVPNPGAGESTPQVQPDTHPLAGAYLYTLGTAFEGHNYFQPQFSIGEDVTNNASFGTNPQGQWVWTTLPETSLSLVDASRRNQFSVNYIGGGYIFDNSRLSHLNGVFQSFGLTDSVQFRRATLSVTDVFSYLPEAAFGFGGIGGLGGIGGIGSSLFSAGGFGQINPVLTPNQSILTTSQNSINNTALLQVDYALTPRTSVTAFGSYGTLQAGSHATGFLNENDVMGSGGLQHALTPRDTIGVSYYYSTFHYVGVPDAFNANAINFEYGRKITSRLALQLYGGPEFISDHTGTFHQNSVLTSGFGSLTYAAGRNTFGLSGGRYASGGSGVLAGSDTEMINGSWARQLTRKWFTSINGGIARNSELAVQSGAPSLHYNYGFANISLTRSLGRYVSFYLDYSFQRQLTNSGPCTTSSFCAASLSRQTIGAGFIFTPRPIGL